MDINSPCILWGGKQWWQYSQVEPEKSLRLVTEDNGAEVSLNSVIPANSENLVNH